MSIAIASWVWLALVVVFAALEMATVGLVCVWFAAGAVVALIVSAFTSSVLVQVTAFLVVSFATLIFTRPVIKRNKLDRIVPTNADMNVGRKAVVIATITPDLPGRVKLDGVDWSARSEETLMPDTLCVVMALDGATLTVRSEAYTQTKSV